MMPTSSTMNGVATRANSTAVAPFSLPRKAAVRLRRSAAPCMVFAVMVRCLLCQARGCHDRLEQGGHGRRNVAAGLDVEEQPRRRARLHVRRDLRLERCDAKERAVSGLVPTVGR